MVSNRKSEGTATVMGRRTATVASSLMVTKGTTFLIMGLTFILITRLLGPSQFGVYTLATAMAGLFGAFGDLGVSTMFIKFIPQYMQKKQHGKIRSLLRNGYAIIAIESIFFTVIAVLFSGYIAQAVLHNASDTLALQLVSLSIILGVLWNSSYNALIAFGRGGRMVKSVSIQILLQSFVSIVLVIYGFGPIGPILGLDTGLLIGFIYAANAVHAEMKENEVHRATAMRWRNILSFSLPIGMSSVVSSLTSNFSLFALQILSTTVILGNFGAANKAINIFDVLLGSVGIAMLPFFSVALSDKRIAKQISRYYNYALFFAFLFAAPIALYIVVLSKQFSYTIFSGTYSLTPLYLALMSIGALIMVVYSYASNLLIGAGEVKKVFKYNLVASLVQLALLYFFVEPFTGLGLTVLMFIVVPSILSALYLNRMKKLFGMSLDYGRLLRVVFAAIVSALFLLPLAVFIQNNYLLLLLGAVEQLLLYPIIVSLLRAVDREKLGMIGSVTAGIPVFGAVMRILLSYTGMFIKE